MPSTVDLGSPYSPVLTKSTFPLLAFWLGAVGLFFAGLFMWYELSATKNSRRLGTELFYAIVASFFLALGSLYTFLSVGLYV